MPKVNLSEKQRILNNNMEIIAIQAIRTGNKTPCNKIAEKIGMHYSTYCFKLNKGTLDWCELYSLFNLLKFSDEQILEFFGRR